MRYSIPCNDPFFQANETVNDGTGDFESYYWATAMGCTDQHQICLDANSPGTCSPQLGSVQLSGWILNPSLTMTSTQSAIASQLESILALSTLQQSVLGRGYDALRAASTSIYQLGTWQQYGGLPDDQWIIEVNSWFAVQMANLQRSMVAWVSGTSVPYSGGARTLPASIAAELLCHQQMVPLPSGYQNFQFSSILLIIVLGIVIIVLALVVPSVVVSGKKKKKSESYGWLAWTLDEKLQLHRMAQQSSKWGHEWINQLESVPLTQKLPLESGKKVEEPLGLYQVDFGIGEKAEPQAFIEHETALEAGEVERLTVVAADDAGTGSQVRLVQLKVPSPSQQSIAGSSV